jgi:hypothetical protein
MIFRPKKTGIIEAWVTYSQDTEKPMLTYAGLRFKPSDKVPGHTLTFEKLLKAKRILDGEKQKICFFT